MTLYDVSDIETVRKVALLLEAENQKLAREVAKLRREVHELRGGDPEQLALHLAGLEGQLAALRQKIFGDSSEAWRTGRMDHSERAGASFGRRYTRS
ncbi:MAG TPA: hypothetical protein VK550_14395 [Polyangiaceae bacterium]|nr:hypothetical protein [Polyangiaceae bacterium]